MSELNIVDPENEETSESSFPKREMLLKGDYMDRVKMVDEGKISPRSMRLMRLTGNGLTIAVVPPTSNIDDDYEGGSPGIMPGHGGTGGGSAI